MNKKDPSKVKKHTISVRLNKEDYKEFKYLCSITNNTSSECLRLLIKSKYNNLNGGY